MKDGVLRAAEGDPDGDILAVRRRNIIVDGGMLLSLGQSCGIKQEARWPTCDCTRHQAGVALARWQLKIEVLVKNTRSAADFGHRIRKFCELRENQIGR